MMLRHIGWAEAADLVHNGVANAIADRQLTRDLAVSRVPAARAGTATGSEPALLEGARILDTRAFAEAVVQRMAAD
jgi:isocitrate dehydrogenase